jgi:hypothetical protein
VVIAASRSGDLSGGLDRGRKSFSTSSLESAVPGKRGKPKSRARSRVLLGFGAHLACASISVRFLVTHLAPMPNRVSLLAM